MIDRQIDCFDNQHHVKMWKHYDDLFNVNFSFNEFVSRTERNLDFDFIIIYTCLFINHVNDKFFWFENVIFDKHFCSQIVNNV